MVAHVQEGMPPSVQELRVDEGVSGAGASPADFDSIPDIRTLLTTKRCLKGKLDSEPVNDSPLNLIDSLLAEIGLPGA